MTTEESRWSLCDDLQRLRRVSWSSCGIPEILMDWILNERVDLIQHSQDGNDQRHPWVKEEICSWSCYMIWCRFFMYSTNFQGGGQRKELSKAAVRSCTKTNISVTFKFTWKPSALMQSLWDLLPWELRLSCINTSLKQGLSILSKQKVQYNAWIASWEEKTHRHRGLLTEYFRMRDKLMRWVKRATKRFTWASLPWDVQWFLSEPDYENLIFTTRNPETGAMCVSRVRFEVSSENVCGKWDVICGNQYWFEEARPAGLACPESPLKFLVLVPVELATFDVYTKHVWLSTAGTWYLCIKYVLSCHRFLVFMFWHGFTPGSRWSILVRLPTRPFLAPFQKVPNPTHSVHLPVKMRIWLCNYVFCYQVCGYPTLILLFYWCNEILLQLLHVVMKKWHVRVSERLPDMLHHKI